MNFFSLYRGSFYLMLVFAALVFNVDAPENKLAIFYPAIVAAAGFGAYLTVDRTPSKGLSRGWANGLAIGSIALTFLEYRIDERLLVLALGHWLVYLELIKMFRSKSAHDDWSLIILGLVQVVVGAFISQSDQVGGLLLTWVLLTLWVLALFWLYRESLRSQSGTVQSAIPVQVQEKAYAGLLDRSYAYSTIRVMATTLALGVIIFLFTPRFGQEARSRTGDVFGHHLTGFDDEVELGQLGEILENDSIVMSIELFNDKNTKIKPSDEPLWRGVTMAAYDSGRWHRQGRDPKTIPGWDSGQHQGRRTIRQRIRLEANDSPVLFGLRPMVEATVNRMYPLELNAVDGTLSRNGYRPGSFDYEVRSEDSPDLVQPGESYPNRNRLTRLLGLDETLKSRLAAIAEPLVKEIAPEEPIARARALELYLRESGKFSYSLRMNVVDSTLDPVEDFLINRKEGHCEYFASALALMLRSIGIPSRVVNGFKGGDWNELAQVVNVRQKHAHSWVEALVGERPGKVPVWITLDPTPASERDQSVASVGGITTNFRQFTDLVRYIWVFYVVGYNAERQERILYEPIRKLVGAARDGFRIIGRVLRVALATVFPFENVRQLVSVRGFVVSVVILLILVGVVRGLWWLWLRLIRWYRGSSEQSAAQSVGSGYYRRLAQLLGEVGLERPAAETQSEFAHRATQFLASRGANCDAVSDVPPLVVEAFYRVRFGHLGLNPTSLHHLETRLDALENSLRATKD